MHLTPSGAFVLAKGTPKDPIWTWMLEKVDEFNADLLLISNGTRELADITDILQKKYRLSKDEVEHRVRSSLEFAQWKNLLILDNEPYRLGNYRVTGSKEYFVPMHMHVETTDMCNFECIHCYRESGPRSKEVIDCDKLEGALELLSSMGLRIVELTGGEPLLHPQIKKIIDFCLDKFNIVALITNGYFLDEEFIKYFADAFASRKMFVSVSCNSYDAEFHDKFTNVKGSWDRATKAIRMLGEVGALSRFAMNIVPDNMDHLEKTVEFAQSIGAFSFTFSPIMPFGRGVNIDWSKVSQEKFSQFEKIQNKIAKDYGRFVFTIPEELMVNVKNAHCGAGQSSFALSPKGFLRPCVSASEDLFNFGNIFDRPTEEILSNSITMVLDQITAPNSAACSDCKFEHFCNRCWYRGVIASQQVELCRWLQCTPLKEQIRDISALKNLSELSNLDKYHSIKG
jgi:radical SAM protein with 4Fe4S-binding SPASM domain